MAHTAGRTASRTRERLSAVADIGTRPGGRRHPLVAAAMVLPLAVVLAIVFGAVQAVVTQASSVAGMLGY
ncbi:hypothetical protein H181DRAFT_03683 [Streptomyces sp. WMMB 714]|jgi:hypothetical protein|uniref:hypothetical protein n=1 Tax=Streptomyces sp. WMMB 714 TaxID=1286822 RepID=UPI0005F86BA9|nr:hypothetical protein [Streptomyces sp. WMMB 714]SCK42241.1 hypothetical protein H181DRAFT_03683 [Streptomyces sp. WMMB 714]